MLTFQNNIGFAMSLISPYSTHASNKPSTIILALFFVEIFPNVHKTAVLAHCVPHTPHIPQHMPCCSTPHHTTLLHTTLHHTTPCHTTHDTTHNTIPHQATHNTPHHSLNFDHREDIDFLK